MPPKVAYIICTLPRSGSWLFAEALERTGIAGHPREFFHEEHEATWFEKWGITTYAEYLERLLDAKTTPNRVFGMKLHWYQFEGLPTKLSQIPGMEGLQTHELMRRAFCDPQYVFLTRRDKVRQAVSHFRADRSKVWWKIDGIPPPEAAVPESVEDYNYQAIAHFERLVWAQVEGWKRYFSDSGIEPIPVAYEDLTESYEATVLGVLRELGFPIPAGLVVAQPRLRKQSDDITDQWVERYLSDRSARTIMPGLAQVAAASPRLESSPAPAPWPAPRVSVLDDCWRSWVVENKLLRTEDQKIVDVLVRNGVDPHQAAAEVAAVVLDPGYQGADWVAQRFRKLQSLLKVYRNLAALCGGADAVERRPPIPRQEFLESYYARNRPVVLTGLLSGWDALNTWNPGFLKATCGAELVEIMSGRAIDPRYEVNSDQHKREIRFADYVDLIAVGGESNDSYLVANNQFFKRAGARRLLDDLGTLPEYLDPERAQSGTFFWFGPAGTVTPLHHDLMNIFMAQVYGRKRIQLVPSWQTDLVYNNVGVYSEVDPENPDLDRYPLFGEATVSAVTLEPGEVLFVPAGWWHHVRALEVSITVSFTNFVFPNSYEWSNPHIVV